MKKIFTIALMLSFTFYGCENKKKQFIPLQTVVNQGTTSNTTSGGTGSTTQEETTVTIPSSGSNNASINEVQPGATVTVNPNSDEPFNYETSVTIPVDMEVTDNDGNPVNPGVVTIVDPNDNTVLLQQSTTPSGSVTGSITVPATTTNVEVTVTIGGSTCQPVGIPITVPVDTNGVVTNQPISSIGNITLPISNPNGNATQITDRDGDGVDDKNDAYPDDPNKATKVRFPAKGVNTIAFEDLYPKPGDADLNDYVVQFYTEEDLNANGKVVEIRGAYQHVARGAGYRHILNLKFKGDPKVKCKSDKDRGHGNDADGVDEDNPGNSTGVNANGMNNRNENSFKDKDEDCNSSLASYGLTYESSVTDSFGVNQNTGIPKFSPTASQIEAGLQILGNSGNTISSPNAQFNQSYNPGHVAKIKITFEKPVSRSVLGASPYNIYLHVINTKKDIYFPGKYFDSTGKDLYMDSKGFPWAIMVPGVWAWPLERKDIRNSNDTGYPRFNAWAESKGKTDKDWYKTITDGKVYPLPSEPSSLLAYLKTSESTGSNAAMAIGLIIFGLSMGLILKKKFSSV